ncbi:MAG: thioesterase family protein [Parasphingopyxis sp.]|uniref:acyl-CoA thioesterase n=1 Tax=Parasphingopyxis sp. TaxID=1920299 RepID=UPI0026209A5A|nr:thioesterase family protein [uncultured Parasphingopyxis sp.]
MPKSFSHIITAGPDDIDVNGHVNNAVWVQWIQDLAVAHWRSAASAEQDARWGWVVTRHEIDYLRPAFEGDEVTGTTWVEDAARGARFTRHMEFVGAGGRPCVRAVTTWAMIDRERGRPARVPEDVVRLFVAEN